MWLICCRRQVTKEEGQQLANENKLMFVETSAKTGDNVETCFINMTLEIYQKMEKGEYDLTNESLGITDMRPVTLKKHKEEKEDKICGCW